MIDTRKITRVEVIDHRHESMGTKNHGRILVAYNSKPYFETQDGGKTLKIFIDDIKEKDE